MSFPRLNFLACLCLSGERPYSLHSFCQIMNTHVWPQRSDPAENQLWHSGAIVCSVQLQIYPCCHWDWNIIHLSTARLSSWKKNKSSSLKLVWEVLVEPNYSFLKACTIKGIWVNCQPLSFCLSFGGAGRTPCLKWCWGSASSLRVEIDTGGGGRYW